MNISFNTGDGYDSDGDYHQIRDKFRRLRNEKEQLISHYKQRELEFNEERNKNYVEELERLEDANRRVESLRAEYDRSSSDKIREVEEAYKERIRKVEKDFNHKMTGMGSSESPGNPRFYELSDFKDKESSALKALSAKLAKLADEKAKLEKDNIVLGDVKRLLKEKSKQYFDLEDRLNTLESENQDLNKKLRSYKYLLNEKEDQIVSLMEDNNALSTRLLQDTNATKEPGEGSLADVLQTGQSDSCIEKIEVMQAVENLLDLQSVWIKTVVGGINTTNTLISTSQTQRELFHWLESVNCYLENVLVNPLSYDALHISTVSNASFLTGNIETALKTISEKVCEHTNLLQENDSLLKSLQTARKQVITTSRVIDEQTMLIGNLIKEIKRLKLSYKNTYMGLKQEVFKERELRLTEAVEKEKYCHELEKQLAELEKNNRRLEERITLNFKECDNLSNQLRFLVKQKLLLSQQIDEYECHIMQSFNNCLHSEDTSS